jgi:antitoxin component HigA of HigAB toxin-antitoxin module
MSRAILTMALARTFHRQPTDAELSEFLMALRDLAGERVYVPQREPAPVDVVRIVALRGDGLSIRKIARSVGVSKSQVHRALSQMSALPLDTQAA